MNSGIAEFAVLQNGTKYPVIGLGTHNVTVSIYASTNVYTINSTTFNAKFK